MKARKGMEIEIEDLHIQMEDVAKNKISVSFFFLNKSFSYDAWAHNMSFNNTGLHDEMSNV